MRVIICTIPHARQRYPTCGDWWWDRHGTLQIRVSKMTNWRYEIAVAFHELMEALLCKSHGVSQAQTDRFDTGPGKLLDDPGDDPRAPYAREHTAGYIAEYAFLAGCGIAAGSYHRALNRLRYVEDT